MRPHKKEDINGTLTLIPALGDAEENASSTKLLKHKKLTVTFELFCPATILRTDRLPGKGTMEEVEHDVLPVVEEGRPNHGSTDRANRCKTYTITLLLHTAILEQSEVVAEQSRLSLCIRSFRIASLILEGDKGDPPEAARTQKRLRLEIFNSESFVLLLDESEEFVSIIT